MVVKDHERCLKGLFASLFGVNPPSLINYCAMCSIVHDNEKILMMKDCVWLPPPYHKISPVITPLSLPTR